MPSLHQVFISMSVHPGTLFFPNQLSSIGTKQQMPSLSSFFLPPLFLIMSVWHANNQAHALPLLLSHLSCLRMTGEGWGVELHIKDLFCPWRNQESVSNLQFGTGASEAPGMFDTHLVACHQTWGSITGDISKKKPPKHTHTHKQKTPKNQTKSNQKLQEKSDFYFENSRTSHRLRFLLQNMKEEQVFLWVWTYMLVFLFHNISQTKYFIIWFHGQFLN